jgi:hypothetical protein
VTDRFLAHLPIGGRPPFPGDGMPGWEVYPLARDIRVEIPDEPELPEPPRHGMHLRGTCLPNWADVLANQGEARWRAAPAAGGGTAYV